MNSQTEISIIVPVYEEQDSINQLSEEIIKTCEENKYTYEIIFVDDGSKDDTRKLIEENKSKNNCISNKCIKSVF